MDKKFLKNEFNKLLAVNDKFGTWEKELNERLSKGKMSSIMLFEILKRTPIDWDTLWIVSSIQTFSMNSNVENFENVITEAQERGIIKGFERWKQGYLLTARDGTPIRFVQLTDFVSGLDDKTKERLHSNKRSGHCHWDSVQLAEYLQMPCKVVSGYCTMQSKKVPFPHSWVELELNGFEWVMDFAMNEVMNKEGYYKLYNPQKTIAVDNATLVEDLKLRKLSSLGFEDIRMYLFHPDEARQVMLEETRSREPLSDDGYLGDNVL